jgi:hypothetical protein
VARERRIDRRPAWFLERAITGDAAARQRLPELIVFLTLPYQVDD